jgi:hypothetical protein
MLIQFHLAALGHLVLWLWMFYDLHHLHAADWEGAVVLEVFVYYGLPISFAILVTVYILFRCLLAYASFSTALTTMIAVDVLHAIVMGFTIIVPVRLAIPIVLYSIACYSVHRSEPHHTITKQ